MTNETRKARLGGLGTVVAALAVGLGSVSLAGSADSTDGSINLHNHTYCSDGSDTPEALVALAAKSGVSVLSVTDHDNVACVERAKAAALKAGIQLVPGIELSAAGDEMHILGLNIDIAQPGLRALIENGREARLERTKQILAKLAKAKTRDGRPIKIELRELLIAKLNLQLAADGRPALSDGEAAALTEAELLSRITAPMMRPDIAVMMVTKGYVPNTRVAFDEFLGDEGSASAELDGISFEEAIRLVHEAGGLAVLAHPHTIYKGKPLPLIISGKSYANFEALLEAMLEAGLDGVEQYKHNNGPTGWLVAALERYTARSGKPILLTPGSDYHGSSGVGQPLFESLQIPSSEAAKIMQALRRPAQPAAPVLTAGRTLELGRALQEQASRFQGAR